MPASAARTMEKNAETDVVARLPSEPADAAEAPGGDGIPNRLHGRLGYRFKGNKRPPLIRLIRRRMGLSSAKAFAGHADPLETADGEIDPRLKDRLGRSKQELQALNEELTTVNLQLQDKVAQLEASNSDIRNLLASSEIATLCLDRDLRIKWFTPRMQAIGKLLSGDVGRPITDFSTAGLGSCIVEDAAGVLDSLSVKQRELVSPDRRRYLRRIMPYQTQREPIGGVVITYADMTETEPPGRETAAALRKMAASLEERVRERTFQLRTLTSELVLTEERERRILARDLHDGLGQLLAIVKIKLTSLECSERRGRLKTALGEIDALVDQANRSIRSLLLSLSPPTLETLGLVPALDGLGEEMGRLYGLAVRIDAEQELPALLEPAKTTIFRAVRELLINVAKHAGTDIAEIHCYQTDDRRLMISIGDQGRGFDYQQTLGGRTAGVSGFGLISVRERIEFIGGELAVDSKPGYGTTITIVFPAKPGDPSGGSDGDEYTDHSGRRSQDPP